MNKPDSKYEAEVRTESHSTTTLSIADEQKRVKEIVADIKNYIGRSIYVHERIAYAAMKVEQTPELELDYKSLVGKFDSLIGKSMEDDESLLMKEMPRFVLSSADDGATPEQIRSVLDHERTEFWRWKIEGSPHYENIEREDMETFVRVMEENQGMMERPPEFYVNMACAEGFGASNVGAVLNAYLGEPTGFYDNQTGRVVGTFNGIVDKKHLKDIDLTSSDAARHGSRFERDIAATAFETLIEMETGTKPKSILTPEIRKKIAEAGVTGKFVCGIDQLYEVNGKVVLPEFKLPQKLNTTISAASKKLDLSDDHRMQANLEQEAVKAVIGRYPDETHVFYAGAVGATALSKNMTPDNSERIKKAVKEYVALNVKNNTGLVKTKSFKIEPNPALVSTLVKASELMYANHVLTNTHVIEPEDKTKPLPSSPEMNKVDESLAKTTLISETIKQNTLRVEEIKTELVGLKGQLGCEIKAAYAGTNKTRKKMTGEQMLDVAKKKGIIVDVKEFSNTKEQIKKILNMGKLLDLKKEHDLDDKVFGSVTCSVSVRTDNEYNCGPMMAIEGLAASISRQSTNAALHIEGSDYKLEAPKSDVAETIEDAGPASSMGY